MRNSGSFLLVCLLCLVTAAAEKPATSPVHRLQFRLVALPQDKGEVDELENPSPTGDEKTLRVLRDASVDERDVDGVGNGVGVDGARTIMLTFSNAGATKFSAWTREHIGRRLAIVLDGKVLTAPVIRTEIGARAVITRPGGYDEKEQSTVVQSITEAISAARK
jgi:preprotein translocase subunit SecD